mgnify:CR=1 FL=1
MTKQLYYTTVKVNKQTKDLPLFDLYTAIDVYNMSEMYNKYQNDTKGFNTNKNLMRIEIKRGRKYNYYHAVSTEHNYYNFYKLLSKAIKLDNHSDRDIMIVA